MEAAAEEPGQADGQEVPAPFHNGSEAILVAGSRVLIKGNKRSNEQFTGQYAVVRKTGFGSGWHELLLENTGTPVKLQRNALVGIDVLPPEDGSDEGSDSGLEHHQQKPSEVGILSKFRLTSGNPKFDAPPPVERVPTKRFGVGHQSSHGPPHHLRYIVLGLARCGDVRVDIVLRMSQRSLVHYVERHKLPHPKGITQLRAVVRNHLLFQNHYAVKDVRQLILDVQASCQRRMQTFARKKRAA